MVYNGWPSYNELLCTLVGLVEAWNMGTEAGKYLPMYEPSSVPDAPLCFIDVLRLGIPKCLIYNKLQILVESEFFLAVF